MNCKSFTITVIVLWVVDVILSYVLHANILPWRDFPGTVAEYSGGSIVLNIIGGLVFAFMFTFLFVKGREGKGVLEGCRYGLYVGLLIFLPVLFYNYANFQYTAFLNWGFVIGGIIIAIILGILVAAIYKPKAAA